MAKRKILENAKNILYLGGGFVKSECEKVLEYTDYNCRSHCFSYDNFYIANKDIIQYVLDNDVHIVIGEGVGGFYEMFISNEKVADDYNLISRIIINPVLKPSEDLAEMEIPYSITKTYETMETNVYRQKYLDMRHSLCIFSKDNPTIKYADTFTKKTGIKCVVIDHIDDEWIQTNLHDFVNTLAEGKDIDKYIR